MQKREDLILGIALLLITTALFIQQVQLKKLKQAICEPTDVPTKEEKPCNCKEESNAQA